MGGRPGRRRVDPPEGRRRRILARRRRDHRGPAQHRSRRAPPATGLPPPRRIARTISASTAALSFSRSSPDASSWLSWYWANIASASRWDSLEGAPALLLEARDPAPRGPTGPSSGGPRPRAGRIGRARHAERPSSMARTSRKHDVAPGSRWPRDRSPSRNASPRRAIIGMVAWAPLRAARAAATNASWGGVLPAANATQRVGGRPEGIEDRLVADRAAAPPGQPVRPGPDRGGEGGEVDDVAPLEREPALDEGGAVQRARCAADARDDHMADPPERAPIASVVAGRRLVELAEDGLEPDRDVRPVIAVARGPRRAGRAAPRGAARRPRRGARSRRRRPSSPSRRSGRRVVLPIRLCSAPASSRRSGRSLVVPIRLCSSP